MGKEGGGIRKKVLHKFHSYSPPPGAVGSCEESIKRTGGITQNSTVLNHIYAANSFQFKVFCALFTVFTVHCSQCSHCSHCSVQVGRESCTLFTRCQDLRLCTASSPNHRHLLHLCLLLFIIAALSVFCICVFCICVFYYLSLLL